MVYKKISQNLMQVVFSVYAWGEMDFAKFLHVLTDAVLVLKRK